MAQSIEDVEESPVPKSKNQCGINMDGVVLGDAFESSSSAINNKKVQAKRDQGVLKMDDNESWDNVVGV